MFCLVVNCSENSRILQQLCNFESQNLSDLSVSELVARLPKCHLRSWFSMICLKRILGLLQQKINFEHKL